MYRRFERLDFTPRRPDQGVSTACTKQPALAARRACFAHPRAEGMGICCANRVRPTNGDSDENIRATASSADNAGEPTSPSYLRRYDSINFNRQQLQRRKKKGGTGGDHPAHQEADYESESPTPSSPGGSGETAEFWGKQAEQLPPQ